MLQVKAIVRLQTNFLHDQNDRKLADRLGSAEVRLGGTVWSLPDG